MDELEMNEPLVTLVIPYYNEEDFIGPMLEAILAQNDRRFCLILVDNRSTDHSTQKARDVLARAPDVQVEWLQEERKGQLFALMRGTQAARQPFVATLDADTYYPPEYVGRMLRLLEENPAASTAMAVNVGEDRSRKTGGIRWRSSKIWPNKCHAGGAGHCYRRNMLEQAGGFDDGIWPFILFDHEIAHRIRKQGPFVLERLHVCYASERRDDGAVFGWNLFERILYKFLPIQAMDWFFYQFLGPRFAKRGLNSVALRDGDWRVPDQEAPSE